MFQSFTLYGAAYIFEFKVGEEQDGVYFGSEVSVDGGDGLLIFEIFGVANSAQYKAGTLTSAAVDGHVTVAHHLYSSVAGEPTLDHVHAFVDGEHVTFVAVHSYGDDHLVKERQRSPHKRLMAIGEGVERTRKKCYASHRLRFFALRPTTPSSLVPNSYISRAEMDILRQSLYDTTGGYVPLIWASFVYSVNFQSFFTGIMEY